MTCLFAESHKETGVKYTTQKMKSDASKLMLLQLFKIIAQKIQDNDDDIWHRKWFIVLSHFPLTWLNKALYNITQSIKKYPLQTFNVKIRFSSQSDQTSIFSHEKATITIFLSTNKLSDTFRNLSVESASDSHCPQ